MEEILLDDVLTASIGAVAKMAPDPFVSCTATTCDECPLECTVLVKQFDTEGFKKDLAKLINNYSLENQSDTPDFILADYLFACLQAYGAAHGRTLDWFGFKSWAKEDADG
jgi:hypothetical protein